MTNPADADRPVSPDVPLDEAATPTTDPEASGAESEGYSAPTPEDDHGIPGALLRYRIMAWIVGTLLVVLVCVGMPLKYLTDNDIVVRATGVPHGWLYVILLLTAWDLGRRVAWTWTRLILIGLAGTVPFLSFVAEHFANKDVKTRFSDLFRR
ncbi:DUF3817 domain-containing protein [Parenemella sanctibonifatiensis]|uniref:DUF3817 domain-containing protein n=1 Tax=Parenemella sanctibonifatiensis TaxID=2016505 RepID=A0A255EL08_9ACTN|nr:DUF3817 domain-containing protein [Parenemella sanctibonifatiensis]OYN90295.1 hypothetical protein CGZ91_09045 [Parenemella sanctibonifatiensis]